MTDLNIHPSLTFAAPTLLSDGDINFVKFTAIGSNVFNPSDNVTVKVASNNEFLCLDRSYIKFRVTFDTTGTVNPQGLSAVFNSCQDTVSGMQMPIARNWHIKNKITLVTDSKERQSISNLTEGFTTGTATGGACTAATYVDVVMPVPTTLATSDKYLPLAFMNAGLQFSWQLNAANQVVSVGSYIITNFEVVACLITPPNSYLEEIAKGLAGGSALKIPLTLTKSITAQPSAGVTSQVITLQTGYLGSINSVTLVEKAAVSPMVNQDGISSFFISLDGSRYPRNKSVTGASESIYQILAGYSTSLASITLPDAFSRFKQYSFKSNGQFSSGAVSANGTLELNIEFTTVPSTIEAIISYDSLLLMSQNSALLVNDV